MSAAQHALLTLPARSGRTARQMQQLGEQGIFLRARDAPCALCDPTPSLACLLLCRRANPAAADLLFATCTPFSLLQPFVPCTYRSCTVNYGDIGAAAKTVPAGGCQMTGDSSPDSYSIFGARGASIPFISGAVQRPPGSTPIGELSRMSSRGRA